MEDRYPVAYNLGCGDKHWEGWINVDFDDSADLKADVRHLPIESDSADAVAAIHLIEHFYYWEVEDILLEWKRILKPGGKLILELPCMEKIFRYIAHAMNHNEEVSSGMTLNAFYGDPQHKDVAMCHKWGWFKGEMDKMLVKVGMRDIRFKTPRYHFDVRDMRYECIK